MRIIAVRGRNLASLAESFEIDFTGEPLKDSGLFAITGPTGAGKSTLLDAICLALYDSFPRIAERSGEAIGDAGPEAERLRSTDSRTILRRGATECSAEVDFVGVDGRVWRAMWSVQRARNKATGNLQNRKMALCDVEKKQYAGGTLKETLKAIQEKVGLSFDQFRRTIMLAQNDFDAFLRADEKARADLLERITGTEVYARISQIAYERNAEIARQVQEEETRKSLFAGLDPEARLKLEHELAEATAAAREEQKTLDGLRIAGAWYERLAELETACVRAGAAVEEAERAHQRAEGTRRLAQSVERAEQARPMVEAADAAIGRLAEAEAEHSRAVAALSAAKVAHDHASEALDAAAAEAAAGETEATRLEPVWAKASELDHALARAREDEEQCRLRAESFAQEAAAAATAVTEKEAEAARHETEQEANRTWLAAHADDEVLARRIDDVLASLDAIDRARLDQASADRDVARLAEAIDAIDEESRARAVESTALAAELTGLKQQESDRRRALSGIGGSGLKARCDALGAALTAFERVRFAAAQVRDAEFGEHRQTARRSEAEARRKKVAGLLERLYQERVTVTAALEEAHHARERAEKAAGDQAALLRGLLGAGEPCPVCGATDHPWHGRPGPLDALLAEAEARHAEHRQAAEILRSTIEEAQSERGAADGVIADAEAQREGFAGKRRSQEKAFSTSFAAWAKAANEAGLDPGVGEAAALLDPAADTLAATIEAELRKGQEILAESALLENEAEEARREHDAKAEALRHLEDLQKETFSRRSDLESEKARHETRRTAAAESIARMVERLGFVTTPRKLTTETLLEDLPLIRERLAGAAETWSAEAGKRDGFAAAAADIRAAAERARDRRAAVDERLAEAKGEHEARRSRLDVLEKERSGLLGGTSTEVHRQGVLDRLRADRQRQEEASEAHADARAAHAAAENGVQAARRVLDAAQASLVAAEAERDRMLAELSLAPESARALLTKGWNWLATTRTRLEALDRDLRDATLRREDSAAEIERHRTSQPAESTDDLSTRIGTSQERLADLTRRAGALGEQIGQDERKRHESEAAETRIGALRSRHEIWHAVSEAIGSAKGDKFRSFVQAITLDQLLGLANEQFATLNPRYRLERAPTGDLSLQIRDLEMGDEIRSVRSLSGGERFLASLALALGLSDLSSRRTFARTLFIDEGFGSLDAASLDMAVSALEALHSRGRQVGVISHVEAMTDRIAVQVRVTKVGGGRSRISVI